MLLTVSVLTTSIMRPAPFAGGPGNFNLAADWSSGRRMRGAAAAVGILILSPRAGGLPRPSPARTQKSSEIVITRAYSNKQDMGGGGSFNVNPLHVQHLALIHSCN